MRTVILFVFDPIFQELNTTTNAMSRADGSISKQGQARLVSVSKQTVSVRIKDEKILQCLDLVSRREKRKGFNRHLEALLGHVGLLVGLLLGEDVAEPHEVAHNLLRHSLITGVNILQKC